MAQGQRTTTLYDYMFSELINAGKNEFWNGHQLTYFDDEHSFMKKIINYDSDISFLVDKRFFYKIRMENEEYDTYFKRMFCNRFLHREFKFETVEMTASQVVYCFMAHKDTIENCIQNIVHFSTGSSITNTIDDALSTNNYRGALQSLPQTSVNLDLNNEGMEFADNNNISKNKVKDDRETNTISQNYNPDVLEKSLQVFHNIMNDFDKRCFLQIW